MKTDFAKGAAWAIVPERFDELARQYHEAVMSGKQAEQIVTIGEKWNERILYRVSDDGIATIQINGPLAKNTDFFDRLFGIIDYLDVQAAVRESGDDPRVSGIILDIDSPGGTVNGADETAEAIFAVRGVKPIIAYSRRLVDRALRPLFPEDYFCEVQVLITLISSDPEVMPDAMACLAASAALAVSDIPSRKLRQ